MKKNFIAVGAFLVILVSKNIFADTELEIGEEIYNKSFGKGCGACHDIASNPQLPTLIQAGELDLASFSDTLINGKNGMPKSIAAIMSVEIVQEVGYTEEQAINAVYRFLEEVKQAQTPVTPLPEDTEEIIKLEDNSAILGKWKIYAETDDLDREKEQVDIDWNFKNNGILSILSHDSRTDKLEEVSLKYSIVDGIIKIQLQPGRELTQDCRVIQLDGKNMTLHCKFLYFFLKKQNTYNSVALEANFPCVKLINDETDSFYTVKMKADDDFIFHLTFATILDSLNCDVTYDIISRILSIPTIVVDEDATGTEYFVEMIANEKFEFSISTLKLQE